RRPPTPPNATRRQKQPPRLLEGAKWCESGGGAGGVGGRWGSFLGGEVCPRPLEGRAMRVDAEEFLHSLFADDGLPPGPGYLPPEWHCWWDERAAILEHDAGLHREHAEAAALRMVHEQMRLSLHER